MDSPLLLMVTKVTWIFLVGFNGLAFVSRSFKLLGNWKNERFVISACSGTAVFRLTLLFGV